MPYSLGGHWTSRLSQLVILPFAVLILTFSIALARCRIRLAVTGHRAFPAPSLCLLQFSFSLFQLPWRVAVFTWRSLDIAPFSTRHFAFCSSYFNFLNCLGALPYSLGRHWTSRLSRLVILHFAVLILTFSIALTRCRIHLAVTGHRAFLNSSFCILQFSFSLFQLPWCVAVFTWPSLDIAPFPTRHFAFCSSYFNFFNCLGALPYSLGRHWTSRLSRLVILPFAVLILTFSIALARCRIHLAVTGHRAFPDSSFCILQFSFSLFQLPWCVAVFTWPSLDIVPFPTRHFAFCSSHFNFFNCLGALPYSLGRHWTSRLSRPVILPFAVLILTFSIALARCRIHLAVTGHRAFLNRSFCILQFSF